MKIKSPFNCKPYPRVGDILKFGDQQFYIKDWYFNILTLEPLPLDEYVKGEFIFRSFPENISK